jgi:hypothetical protein
MSSSIRDDTKEFALLQVALPRTERAAVLQFATKAGPLGQCTDMKLRPLERSESLEIQSVVEQAP